ncbi:MAG: hypothetical protein LPK25_09165 [Cyclobacteriaceae bacterium]|nr:hypothetical protein [Cyclobacteriaceae bacterium]MDX5466775.1 hypothetical protein [Cyclobacteriaceae bacterium]
MDASSITKAFRDQGTVTIQDGNSQKIRLIKPELWEKSLGMDWTYLLFDIFQIRSVSVPFSEISLDVVEFASKPTIYHSPANPILKNGPIENGNIRFSVIREPHWNKLLFQISQPVLAKVGNWETVDFQTTVYYPLLMSAVKELFLGPEGEVKIIKA